MGLRAQNDQLKKKLQEGWLLARHKTYGYPARKYLVS
jgi:hypothetical protein